MSDLAQPRNTPTEIYRVAYGYRLKGGPRMGEWREYHRYYWTVEGVRRYGTPRGTFERADEYVRIEYAEIESFREVEL